MGADCRLSHVEARLLELCGRRPIMVGGENGLENTQFPGHQQL